MSDNIQALPGLLRKTAERLDDGARYEWGHMGRCNCGHLVQTLTEMTDREIVETVDHQMDEWSEHANTYCSRTGHSVDAIFKELERVGFSHRDVVALECLSDPRVRSQLGNRYLRKNFAPDVSLYMRTLATVIESEGRPKPEPHLARC